MDLLQPASSRLLLVDVIAEASTIAQRRVSLLTRLWTGMHHIMQKWQNRHRLQQPSRLAAKNTQQQDGCFMTIQPCSDNTATSWLNSYAVGTQLHPCNTAVQQQHCFVTTMHYWLG